MSLKGLIVKIEKINNDKLREAKKKLRNITFSPRPVNVCEHLIDENFKYSEVRYIALQFFEDSYNLFWCCAECGKKNKIPFPGIFVVDEEEGRLDFDKFFITKKVNNENFHPYEELLKKEKNFISREDFERKYKKIVHTEILNSPYKIPYGIDILEIKNR